MSKKKTDRWRQSGLFSLLVPFLRFLLGPMKTVWQTPFDEGSPAIFVCNHDSAYGPIAMCARFELYKAVRPWINSEVLSVRKMPSYVRGDFWWPQNAWYTKILDYTVAYIAALLLPAILRGSACIPVYHDSGVITTLKDSVDALKSGHPIILFPEHPTGYREYGRDVMTGFTSLGKLTARRTGLSLKFYPTYIDWKAKKISIASPLTYDKNLSHADLEETISTAAEAFFARRGDFQ
ncbi:MAG: hypothetical protein LBM18_01720 [Oscillospiraceae bacterium]|nr:hypothetical protein [Oscillospiraceae bacterium]